MPDQPNIVFLMTDQQRTDHVGWAEDARLQTPNLDRLAAGTVFDHCVTPNPICTPARSCLLTGKYSHQIGMLNMSGDLSHQHPTYARALQNTGYHTAAIGKFHWCQGWPWGVGFGEGHPLSEMHEEFKAFGFDEVWEATGKQLAQKNHCDWCERLDQKGILQDYREFVRSEGRNVTAAREIESPGRAWPFDEEDYVDIVTGDRIIESIENRPADKPLFLFGSFCSPHAPFDPPQRFLDMVDADQSDPPFVPPQEEWCAMDEATIERVRSLRRMYKAMVLCVDEQVGRVLDALENAGIADSTIVLFCSDHGEMLGDRGMTQKSQPFRQSANVPAAVFDPRIRNSQRCATPVNLIDLTATILDAAGLDPQAALSKDWPAYHDVVPARSLLPIVRGETDRVRDYAFSECRNQWRMIETDRWQYIRWLSAETAPGEYRESLYDRIADPDALNDLAADPAHADALRDCRARCGWEMDRTPAAQLQWAPYGPPDDRVVPKP